MIVFYGDYKDLNFVSDRIAPDDERFKRDTPELIPIWEKFKSGNVFLEKGKVSDDELHMLPKIIIRNKVFRENEYTTYTLVRGNGNKLSLSHFKEFSDKFIDRENGFIVLEADENTGEKPKNLEEVKAREIAWEKKIFDFFEKDNSDLDEEIIVSHRKRCEETIAKWESKTETRWFHETELTKSSSEIEQIAKEFEFVPGTEEPCDSQGYEYFVDCVYKDEIFPVFIAIESSFPMNIQAAQQIYRQLTREEREER